MKIIDLINDPKHKEKFVMQKLICHHTNISREEIWTHADDNLSEDTTQKILSDYSKYAEDTMPMEYILWYVEFFNNKFKVTQDTLIPRPETEYMIEAVTEHITSLKLTDNNNLLMDIGTWCGVLWTSVLLQNPDTFDHAILTDIADETLEVAQKNFNNYFPNPSFKIDFLNSSLLDFLIQKEVPLQFNEEGKQEWGHTILISNAPYIPDLTLDTEVQANVLKREPRVALVWWNDGLDLYRIMLEQLIKLKINNISIFFEMMTRQVDILRKEFWKQFNFKEVKTFHANIRIVSCEFILDAF